MNNKKTLIDLVREKRMAATRPAKTEFEQLIDREEELRENLILGREYLWENPMFAKSAIEYSDDEEVEFDKKWVKFNKWVEEYEGIINLLAVHNRLPAARRCKVCGKSIWVAWRNICHRHLSPCPDLSGNERECRPQSVSEPQVVSEDHRP